MKPIRLILFLAIAVASLHGQAIKIILVGDSTVATGGGWGPGFCALMSKNITCTDVALNGRSTKSFIAEGAWQKALDLRGNYYLIQFGHNDQKANDPTRYADPDIAFPANLRRMVADVRAIGAIPVLVTSLSRRNYKDGQLVLDLTPYVDATKKVAAAEHTPLIDLNALSVAMLQKMSQADADKFDAVAHPDARAENSAAVTLDRTHLNALGQRVFGRIVAHELARVQPALAADILTPAN